MSLQVVKELSLVKNMNVMIDIKVLNLSNPKSKQFVDPVPACHHLYIVHEDHDGDSKGDDYLSAGQNVEDEFIFLDPHTTKAATAHCSCSGNDFIFKL